MVLPAPGAPWSSLLMAMICLPRSVTAIPPGSASSAIFLPAEADALMMIQTGKDEDMVIMAEDWDEDMVIMVVGEGEEDMVITVVIMVVIIMMTVELVMLIEEIDLVGSSDHFRQSGCAAKVSAHYKLYYHIAYVST